MHARFKSLLTNYENGRISRRSLLLSLPALFVARETLAQARHCARAG
jgi:hypothetical protein